MDASLPLNALQFFKRAVIQAYPGNKELPPLALDSTLSKAWQDVSRLLGVDSAALAQKLAPIYGVQAADDLYGVPPDVLGLVPYNFCQSNAVLPLRLDKGVLWVACA